MAGPTGATASERRQCKGGLRVDRWRPPAQSVAAQWDLAMEPAAARAAALRAWAAWTGHLLRMPGFDTLYPNYADDSTITAISETQGRIIFTCNRQLLKRSNITHGCQERLPPKVHLDGQRFCTCGLCRRVLWEGAQRAGAAGRADRRGQDADDAGNAEYLQCDIAKWTRRVKSRKMTIE